MPNRLLTRQFSDMGREIQTWHDDLAAESLNHIFSDLNSKHVAIFSADMIVGFCEAGALASERVNEIACPISFLFRNLYYLNVNKFVLVQEWHDPHAKEFSSYPAHGIRETREAETIERLAKLPFANLFTIFRKNSLSPAGAREAKRIGNAVTCAGMRFEEYLRRNDLHLAIVVGNCTDLCVRELAMFLRLWANEHQKDMRVLIPANCVQTFDMDFKTARKFNAKPHPGDVYHLWALYEMSRNGIEIVTELV